MGEESINPSESNHHEGVVGWKAPIIHVDGPCGAPAQHYKNYQVLLLVVSANLHHAVPACM